MTRTRMKTTQIKQILLKYLQTKLSEIKRATGDRTMCIDTFTSTKVFQIYIKSKLKVPIHFIVKLYQTD